MNLGRAKDSGSSFATGASLERKDLGFGECRLGAFHES